MPLKQLNILLKSNCEKIKPCFKQVLTLNLMADIPNIFKNPNSFMESFLKKPSEYGKLFLPM